MTKLQQIIDTGNLTVPSIAKQFKLPTSTVYSWASGRCEPSQKYKKIAGEIKMYLQDNKKIEFHPSFGFATPWQIKRLDEIGICAERDRIMRDIATQTKKRGKK